MVNPKISYKTKLSSKQSGIGICLKAFLLALDKYSIQHEPENIIRAKLKRTKQCVTRSKQYFLNEKSRMHFISRKCIGDIKCKPCVCIPFESVPREFVELFTRGM